MSLRPTLGDRLRRVRETERDVRRPVHVHMADLAAYLGEEPGSGGRGGGVLFALPARTSWGQVYRLGQTAFEARGLHDQTQVLVALCEVVEVSMHVGKESIVRCFLRDLSLGGNGAGDKWRGTRAEG